MSPRKLSTNCTVANCPNAAHYQGKCREHARTANREHNQRYAKVYDAQHERARSGYQKRMDRGEAFTCWRCADEGRPHMVDPTSWDLGHRDGLTSAPECIKGNRGAPRKG